MFYDRYVKICNDHGVSPSKAAIDAGLSKSTVSKWKNTPNSEPNGAVLKKLSDYFCISISDLLGESEKKEQPPVIEGLSLEGISPEDVKTIRAYLDMPEDQRRALAKILGVSE